MQPVCFAVPELRANRSQKIMEERLKHALAHLEDDKRVSAHGEFDSDRVSLLDLRWERHLGKNVRPLRPLRRLLRLRQGRRCRLSRATAATIVTIAAAAATTRTCMLYDGRTSATTVAVASGASERGQGLFRAARMEIPDRDGLAARGRGGGARVLSGGAHGAEARVGAAAPGEPAHAVRERAEGRHVTRVLEWRGLRDGVAPGGPGHDARAAGRRVVAGRGRGRQGKQDARRDVQVGHLPARRVVCPEFDGQQVVLGARVEKLARGEGG